MAQQVAKHTVEADGLTINLRQPIVAGVLAWLLPGAGHFYQGRYGKAGLFFFSIISLFVIGLVIGNWKVVYYSWKPEDRRWHYICQAGIGLPAFPAMIEANRAKKLQAPLFPIMRPPRNSTELDAWHNQASAGFDLGTLYTMIAGLLNILVVFDAIGGPLPPPTHDRGSKKSSDSESDDQPDSKTE